MISFLQYKQVNPTKHTDHLLFQSASERTMQRFLLIIIFAFLPEELFTFVEINRLECTETLKFVSILPQVLIVIEQINVKNKFMSVNID